VLQPKDVDEPHEEAGKGNREWTPMDANKRGMGFLHSRSLASIRGLKIMAVMRDSSR
jgi:hypothetical protein